MSQSIVDIVKNGDVDKLQSFLQNLPASNKHVLLNEVDKENGRTALHYATATANFNVVRLLVSAGVDLNVLDSANNTPLNLAQASKQDAIVQLLKFAGAVSRDELHFDPQKVSSYVNLASDRLGARVLFTNDEWFAAASNLLKNGRGTFSPQTFTDAGQLYDGWETARHGAIRRGNRDYCIIKLGTPGIVRGFDIDTNHFTGNYAPEASVDGYYASPDQPDSEILSSEVGWTEILPHTQLGPSAQHIVPATLVKRWTHLRFSIYPDGGVARFRAYGDVTPDWTHVKENEVVDLASILNGGKGVYVSDSYFSKEDNAIMPGRGVNMGDGWETRRSRRKEHREWLIIRLGRPGIVDQVEIDTNHFKGNYPHSCTVHGSYGEGGEWKELLPVTLLKPHIQQYFDKDLINKEVGPITHVRVTIFPDGGISRVRINGRPLNLSQISESELLKSLDTHVKPLPLTEETFYSFGQVFSTENSLKSQSNVSAPWEAQLSGPTSGQAVASFLHLSPVATPVQAANFQRSVSSTVTFVPMNVSKNFLLVVALPSKNGNTPDLLNLSAFVANGNQAVNIKAGNWYSVVALEEAANLMVFSFQSESQKAIVQPNKIWIH